MRVFELIKKSYVSIVIIVVVVTVSMGSMVYAASGFSDVKSSDWFKSDLEYILNDSRKILSGYPDGSYKQLGHYKWINSSSVSLLLLVIISIKQMVTGHKAI